MRAVNLLPRDVARESSGRGRAPYVAAAAGFVLVTALAVVLFVSASGSISHQRSQLDSLEASLSTVPGPGPSVATGSLAQERTNRVAALAAALTTRVPVDRVLHDLALVLPDDAWLTGLTASGPTSTGATATPAGTPAPAAASTQGISIQGATYSQASVARVLARLATIPSLEHVQLSASARVVPAAQQDGSKAKPRQSRKPVVSFAISADFRTGSGS
jgi:Tfp pilus assembly protein PilN